MWATWNVLVVLVALLLTLNHNHGAIFKFTNAVCESYNESWVVVNTCHLQRVQRTKNNATLDIEFNIIYPADDITLWLQLQKKMNGYRPWLINFTIDACEFLRKRNHPYVNLFFALLKDKTTVNHTCPYVGLNGVKDLSMRRDLFHLPLPTGEYKLRINYSFNRKPTISVYVYFIYEEELKRTH